MFFIRAWINGHFESLESLREYIGSFGFWGPLILTLVQAVQVVIPILPGFLGSLVGGVLFGLWGGFWCNYIGISVGSLLAFLIAKKCGKPLVDKMFHGEKYEKVTFDKLCCIAALLCHASQHHLCLVHRFCNQ